MCFQLSYIYIYIYLLHVLNIWHDLRKTDQQDSQHQSDARLPGKIHARQRPCSPALSSSQRSEWTLMDSSSKADSTEARFNYGENTAGHTAIHSHTRTLHMLDSVCKIIFHMDPWNLPQIIIFRNEKMTTTTFCSHYCKDPYVSNIEVLILFQIDEKRRSTNLIDFPDVIRQLASLQTLHMRHPSCVFKPLNFHHFGKRESTQRPPDKFCSSRLPLSAILYSICTGKGSRLET